MFRYAVCNVTYHIKQWIGYASNKGANGGRGKTYFHAIVDDCIDLLKYFDEVLVLFAHRSANIVAHSLARATHSMSGLTEWIDTALDFIICMLDFDNL